MEISKPRSSSAVEEGSRGEHPRRRAPTPEVAWEIQPLSPIRQQQITAGTARARRWATAGGVRTHTRSGEGERLTRES